MRIIQETNDNGPDMEMPVFDPRKTSLFVFESGSGGFRLLKFSDTVAAVCQAPAPLMNQREVEYRRGTKADLAAAKRTFGDEGGLPFQAPAKKPSFLRIV